MSAGDPDEVPVNMVSGDPGIEDAPGTDPGIEDAQGTDPGIEGDPGIKGNTQGDDPGIKDAQGTDPGIEDDPGIKGNTQGDDPGIKDAPGTDPGIEDDPGNAQDPGKQGTDPGIAQDLRTKLDAADKRAADLEEKLKHAMADFQNMARKTASDIENGINSKMDGFMLDFLTIYDDLVLARSVFSEAGADTAGLDSILRNADSLLKKHRVAGIDALGEIFDPSYHEAISTMSDPALDENTITREIRKGYISHERVIRPTLVEISKKG